MQTNSNINFIILSDPFLTPAKCLSVAEGLSILA